MASYIAPSENNAIFNTEDFIQSSDELTIDVATSKFLRYPVAQGSETFNDSVYINNSGSITMTNTPLIQTGTSNITQSGTYTALNTLKGTNFFGPINLTGLGTSTTTGAYIQFPDNSQQVTAYVGYLGNPFYYGTVPNYIGDYWLSPYFTFTSSSWTQNQYFTIRLNINISWDINTGAAPFGPGNLIYNQTFDGYVDIYPYRVTTETYSSLTNPQVKIQNVYGGTVNSYVYLNSSTTNGLVYAPFGVYTWAHDYSLTTTPNTQSTIYVHCNSYNSLAFQVVNDWGSTIPYNVSISTEIIQNNRFGQTNSTIGLLNINTAFPGGTFEYQGYT